MRRSKFKRIVLFYTLEDLKPHKILKNLVFKEVISFLKKPKSALKMIIFCALLGFSVGFRWDLI